MKTVSIEDKTPYGIKIYVLASDVHGDSDRTQIHIDFSECDFPINFEKKENVLSLWSNGQIERSEIIYALEKVLDGLKN